MLMLVLMLLFQVDAGTIRRSADIYPHPRDPEHLQSVVVEVSASRREKVLWWTREVPAQGKISIQQARARGGWWTSAVRYLDLDGKWSGEVPLDPTLRKDNIVLVILLDEQARQVASVEIHAGDLSKGVVGKLVIQ